MYSRGREPHLNYNKLFTDKLQEFCKAGESWNEILAQLVHDRNFKGISPFM
jgi:hypothetical protein